MNTLCRDFSFFSLPRGVREMFSETTRREETGAIEKLCTEFFPLPDPLQKLLTLYALWKKAYVPPMLLER